MKMMIFRNFKYVNKAVAAVLAAAVFLTLSLVVLNLQVLAGFRTSGAEGCGEFDDAIDAASDGDTVAQMIIQKETNSKLITKNLLIHGGWVPPESGCNAPDTYTDTTELEQIGFDFVGTLTPSLLTDFNNQPVLRIDPSVLTLTLQHIALRNESFLTAQGGGIYGVISNGARVRLDDVMIYQSTVTDTGGGLHLEIRGGSQLVIANSKIFSNAANSGGGFDIALYDGSQLIIEDTTVVSNTAGAGYGGGGRIRIMNSGHISITNSRFENNTGAFGGNSLAIETEPGASGEVWLLDSEIEASDIYTSGDGVLAIHYLTQKLYLPVTMKNPVNNALAARITSIVISNTNYVVDFETDNYTPSLPGQHVHFFFNTVPPDQAGAPGSGPWKVYGGSSPFTDYNVIDRPVGAWQMCILVANPNHSVQAGSGNCVDLP